MMHPVVTNTRQVSLRDVPLQSMIGVIIRVLQNCQIECHTSPLPALNFHYGYRHGIEDIA